MHHVNRIIVIATMYTLSYLGHAAGFDVAPTPQRVPSAYAMPEIPAGYPDQMWSEIEYGLDLNDPFFNQEEWIYPARVIKYPDKSYAAHVKPKYKMEQKTARCFVLHSQGNEKDIYSEVMESCKAKIFQNGMIELFIGFFDYPGYDRLAIRINKGRFSCYHWNHLTGPQVRWITTKQKMVLDKESYIKGDEIKGKIELEFTIDNINTRRYHDIGGAQKTKPVIIKGAFRALIR